MEPDSAAHRDYGISAGGELAVLAATRFDAGKPEAPDPVDRVNSRPDFEALIYPGVRAENIQITKDTPQTFMLCADNDKGPSLALAGLYPMLKSAGVPTEVHVYASGGHGFGINEKPRQTPITTTWWLRFGDWMSDRGLLKKD
jgi:acetyl esterase/lipase